MFRRYRYVVATLLFTAAVINYVDRSAIGVAAPLIARELHLGPGEMGAVFSAFFAGYALFGLVGGVLADRFGPRRVYAATMTAWSLFCGATVLATNFAGLAAIRFLFGLGEGPQTPLTAKTVRSWFPREEAGAVMGTVLNTGNMLGAAVAGPLVGLLALSFGWRTAFLVITLLGLAWVVPWLAFAADTPGSSRRVRPEELAMVAASQAKAPAAGAGPSVASLFVSPSVLVVAAALFASQYVNYLLLSWLPSYLATARHLDLARMSFATAIPWLLGAAGAVAGGAVSDWLFRRSGNALAGRKLVGIVGLLVAAACMAVADSVSSAAAAVAVIGLGNFTLHMVPSACWVLIGETVPGHRVGTVTGYASTLGTTSGIISPFLSGLILSRGGSYGLSFDLACAVAVAGALALLLFVRSNGGPTPVATRDGDGFAAPGLAGRTGAGRPLPR